ncbi:hypothetical protein BGZ46_004518 [Entomortierella lignicola]|nr:hypothetical protein BGZ46_004518 [Entomortierella lignicola]
MIPRTIVTSQLARSALLRSSSSYPSRASLVAARCLINAKQSSWRDQRQYSGSATPAQSEKDLKHTLGVVD